VTIPLAVNYLGTERFGLWMTISSFVALLNVADLGIGNGLVNAIAEAKSKNNVRMAKRYVSSGFFLLLGIALVWSLAFTAAYPWISWQSLFGLSDATAIAEAGPAIAVFAGCFFLNVPLGVIQRIQMGYQQGHIHNLWEAFGKLLGLVGVIYVVYTGLGLPWLVLAFTGGPVLAMILNGFFLFFVQRRHLTPQWSQVEAPVAKKLGAIGTMFFILSLAEAIGFSADNIVISNILGAEMVAHYAIPKRLFLLIPIFMMMFSAALWPAYREAILSGDANWVKTSLVRTSLISIVVGGAASLILLLWGNSILRLWVGPNIQASPSLLLGLSVWVVLTSLGNVQAMFLHGVNALHVQVLTMVLYAIIGITIKIFVVSDWGLEGVIWTSVVAYALIKIVPVLFIIPRVLRNIQNGTANLSYEA
jgi:O-antigen/teichoic acid export membrane protein